MRSKGISGHDDKEGFYEPLHKAQSSGDTEAVIRFEDNTVLLLPHPPWFPSLFLLLENQGKNWSTLFILVESECGCKLFTQRHKGIWT